MSDEDLGLPGSPSTPPRNGTHSTDDHNTSNGNSGRGLHHSSLGLLSMSSSEIFGDDSMDSGTGFLSQSKSSYEIGSNDELDLNVTREPMMRLSHSAAKHKMAVRPKKKGPSRPPRKPIEVSCICIEFEPLQTMICSPIIQYVQHTKICFIRMCRHPVYCHRCPR